MFIGANAGALYPHYPVCDGDTFVLSSKYAFVALETPGHTPGCITWVLSERPAGGALAAGAGMKPLKAFTGDTLFVGSIGRPDLLGSVGYTAESMASLLYHSLHDKLMALPDDVEVHPAHGPGSPCGKNISPEHSSTIGKVVDLAGHCFATQWHSLISSVYRVAPLFAITGCNDVVACNGFVI